MKVAKTAVQLQKYCIAAYPHASVAWYVHPPALAKADYSAIDRLLEGSLVRRCGTDAIYVRWIGGEQFKHCSTRCNIRCVGLRDLLKFKLLPKMIEYKLKCS